MRTPIALFSASLLLASVCGTALGMDPPSAAAQVDRAVQAFDEAWSQRQELSAEELKQCAVEAVQGLDVEALSGVQLGRLLAFPTLLGQSGCDGDVREALKRFMDDPGPDGATAHIQTLTTRVRENRDPEAQAAMLKAAITHPGLSEALQAGAVRHLFMRLVGASPAAMRMCADELFDLQRFLTRDNARQLALSFRDYHDILKTVDADDSRVEERERIRQTLVTLGRLAAETETNQFFAMHMRSHASFLGLVGSEAPELTITWSSDPAIDSLASLKGRVVVIDFWATWCGPCIRSFPQVRELVDHYAGYPVTVLGVTSIQDRHTAWNPDGSRETIDTQDDPEKERSLMPGFMSSMDVTWPVIFTEEAVFNPDYGVRGIPHVAIVDAKGRVRYNGLHPALPAGRSLEDKASKIDALLREAGLPTPPPPVDGGEAAEAAAPDR